MKTLTYAVFVSIALVLVLGGCAAQSSSAIQDSLRTNTEFSLRLTTRIVEKVREQGGRVCVRSLDGQDTMKVEAPDELTLKYQFLSEEPNGTATLQTAYGSIEGNNRLPVRNFIGILQEVDEKGMLTAWYWYNADNGKIIILSNTLSIEISRNELITLSVLNSYIADLKRYEMLTNEKFGIPIECPATLAIRMMTVM